MTGYRITGGGQTVQAGSDARQATLDGLSPGSEVRIGVAALSGGAAGPIALSAAVRLPVAPVITPAVTPVPTPVGPAATPTPTPTPTAKPTISFKGAPKKITLSRKRTFVLRFKATPRLKGTYTLSGVKKKGTFKADAKGNVKLTIRTSAKRSLKVKITAASGAVRATHTFRLVVRRR